MLLGTSYNYTIEKNGLLPKMRSAYRRYHSTEMAVLKIVSKILCAADRGDATFLCLLDMSAAFDTVDHDILVERIEKAFGLRGQVLEWIKSFLLTRTQTVMLNGKQLSSSELPCGVPQGSVLGPILFLLYTADIMEIANHMTSRHTPTQTTRN